MQPHDQSKVLQPITVGAEGSLCVVPWIIAIGGIGFVYSLYSHVNAHRRELEADIRAYEKEARG